MNSRAHWLSLFSAVVHLTIGATELLQIGPRFLPASWVQIYALVPGGQWLWPGMFTLTGLVAVVGIWTPNALRLGFQMSAVIFLIWGLVGLYAWSIGMGGNIPGSFANLYVAGAAWVLARYVTVGVRADQINEQVVRLAEKVYEIDEHLLVPPDKGA